MLDYIDKNECGALECWVTEKIKIAVGLVFDPLSWGRDGLVTNKAICFSF